MGRCAVFDCGISCSYSLTFFFLSVVVKSIFSIAPMVLVGLCVLFLYVCYCVVSIFAVISLGKREVVPLLYMSLDAM